MRDFVLASGMRVLWWFDSCVAKFHPLPPFLATGGMKFAPRVPLWGRNSPDPLVPAKPCAKTDRGGVQRSPQLSRRNCNT
ncbi:MAG: hypothetical protein E7051_04030 [Lentisphaerae bacterium]|nr:hypothetical protein [Lentisphaerota bacterium]